jgi:hypothetical protein
MDLSTSQDAVELHLPGGTVLFNPGGGTTEVVRNTGDVIRYRRGKSTIRVLVSDLYDAYAAFQGRSVSSTELKAFRPSVFNSSARPAGHDCNCTFLFLLLREIGKAGDVEGSGKRGDPFCVPVFR